MKTFTCAGCKQTLSRSAWSSSRGPPHEDFCFDCTSADLARAMTLRVWCPVCKGQKQVAVQTAGLPMPTFSFVECDKCRGKGELG